MVRLSGQPQGVLDPTLIILLLFMLLLLPQIRQAPLREEPPARRPGTCP